MKKGKMICFPVNLDEYRIPQQFAAGSGRVYLIPQYLFDNLLNKLALIEYTDCNTIAFVERHLRLIEYFITSERTYYKNIRRICGGTKGKGYQLHFKILKDFIIGRDKYQPNVHPFNYQLNTDVNKWLWIFFERNEASDRSVKLSLDSNHPLNNELFISTLGNATLNLVDVIEAEYWHCIRQKRPLSSMLKRLQKSVAFLSAPRSITKGAIVNRVYSSFTSMTSVSRKHITYQGRYFIEIDVSNCQPLLLIALFEINNKPYDVNYLTDVLSGTFYNRMKEYAAANSLFHEEIYEVELKRKEKYSLQDDIKALCFRTIFFSKNSVVTKSPTLSIFRFLYPTTYESLIDLRPLKGEPTIAKRLQDLEAEIVLSVIPNCPYFPVHDGIYCLDEAEVPRIKEEIQLNFSRLCGKELGKIQFKLKEGGFTVNQALPLVEPQEFFFAKRKKRIRIQVINN